jgi:hypothetical protein
LARSCGGVDVIHFIAVDIALIYCIMLRRSVVSAAVNQQKAALKEEFHVRLAPWAFGSIANW